MHITSVAARVIDCLQLGIFGCAAQKHSTTQVLKIIAELAFGCRVTNKKKSHRTSAFGRTVTFKNQLYNSDICLTDGYLHLTIFSIKVAE